jgi:hypothetical protein
MTETPEQRVARLQHEVDQARIDDLNRQLAAAQAAAGHPVTPGQVFSATPGQPIMINLGQGGAGGFAALENALPPEVRARLTPQVQQLIANFQQQAVGQRLGFGSMLTPAQSAPPPAGPPLAPAPRAVPWQFKAVVLPWSWWTVFALVMISVAPGIVWIGIPLAGAVVAALTFLFVVVRRLRRDALQLSLLKWGEVATVRDAETVGVGTYYSGVTYSNVRLAQAHGWQVQRRWYSGPGTSTKITYEINGKQATMGLHGLPYDNGVILADPRKPERALCVSAYAYDLDRDPSGNWIGRLPARVVFGSIAMTVLLLAWTAAMITICTIMALDVDGLVRPFNQ